MGVLTSLLSRVDPVKEYLIAASLIAIAVCSFLFIHHERVIGQQKLAADIAKHELAWQAKVDKVQQNAALEIGRLNGQLALANSRPPPNPLHVRVCAGPSNQAGTVRKDPGPSASGDAAGKPDSGVADNGQGADIGPATEELLNRLDAKIKYLQGYILACQDAGVCER